MADSSKDSNEGEPEVPGGEASEAPLDLSEELIRKWSPERLSRTLAGGKKGAQQRKLDAAEQSRYERRFGVDLSRVRIVTGSFAEEFTAKHSAEAITVGSTGMVLMRQSQAFTGGAAQQSLLAHELTHVAQAMPGVHRKNVSSSAPDSGPGEAEAGMHEQMVLAEEMGVVPEGGGGSGPGGHAGDSDHSPAKKAEEAQERRQKILDLVLDMMDEDERIGAMRGGDS